ncbi:MAG TPA: flagellar basal-body rod protein FlgG [Micropepsaceae bacterium]|jgi:flagellar basal-body rod protein FlgG|nr:flagellar basal-body rod protein FlgG [Micropepsaceae bacterium]
MRALSIAATGMLAQQTNVEVIANNLANMNTTAYKMQRAEFQDLLYQNVERPGSASADTGAVLPAGIQIGVGVRTAATYRITGQGNLSSTSNPYDLAINGKGYFHIQMPDGTDAYTRAGAFSLSPEGQLVTDKGYVVAPGIAIPQDAISVTINAQGQVQALTAASNTPQTLGQIELARFPNDGGLQANGDNLYTETPASGTVLTGLPGSPGYGTLQQGFLETSNVNAVQEITDLITAQRAYEMNSKVISAADQMLQITSKMS